MPKNYRQQRSIISSMGCDGVAASFVIEGAVDTQAFDIYVAEVWHPTIKAGDIFVLDNLTAHQPAASKRSPQNVKLRFYDSRHTRLTFRR